MKRSELYARCWNKPTSAVATELGISDRGLAKLCKRFDIPVPPRGYWAKLRAGKSVVRTSLPDGEDGDVGLIDGLHAVGQPRQSSEKNAVYRPVGERLTPQSNGRRGETGKRRPERVHILELIELARQYDAHLSIRRLIADVETLAGADDSANGGVLIAWAKEARLLAERHDSIALLCSKLRAD